MLPESAPFCDPTFFFVKRLRFARRQSMVEPSTTTPTLIPETKIDAARATTHGRDVRTSTAVTASRTPARTTFTVAMPSFTVAMGSFSLAMTTFTPAMTSFVTTMASRTAAMRSFAPAMRTFAAAMAPVRAEIWGFAQEIA
jgi:hypothetical protein